MESFYQLLPWDHVVNTVRIQMANTIKVSDWGA